MKELEVVAEVDDNNFDRCGVLFDEDEDVDDDGSKTSIPTTV